MGGGGGNSGPTLQQQQLQTEQALTNANLNLEENSQRKSILNAMQGNRVFRGSALSRAVRGNNDQPGPIGPASAAQTSNDEVITPPSTSLLDQITGRNATTAAAATTAGGAGAGGSTPFGGAGGRGGGAARGASQR
jgi:hypothetical protein